MKKKIFREREREITSCVCVKIMLGYVELSCI